MIQETCLLTNFIYNNSIVNSCDFIPDRLNKGTVIYEVVRVIDGIPLFYREHIERFHNSLISLVHELTISKKSLALRIQALVNANKLANGNIRFQLSFEDDNQSTFAAWVTPFFYPEKKLYNTGASLSTILAQRDNPNVKIHNPGLKNNVSAKIRKNDIYEILLINNDGLITEGSRSNIFFVKENKIFTPATSSVLPGITRLKVIEIAKNLSVDCTEADINFDSLPLYNGAFITGTSPKVLPVKNIDEVIFNPKLPAIKKIMTEYNNMMEEDIERFSWARLIEDD